MTSITHSSALDPAGDSVLGWSDLRSLTVDAVLAVMYALVLLPLRGLVRWADRTSSRTTLVSARASKLTLARRRATQPGPTWTITRMLRTPTSRAAARDLDPGRRAQHYLEFRHSPPESPGAGLLTDTNEKRNIDQREPARDAGRHHRGRPAR